MLSLHQMGHSILASLFMATVASASTVAITEFINNAEGDDGGREWVELYNHGSADVDLSGWTLADEDQDSYTFGTQIIGAGDFLILVGGTLDTLNTTEEKKAIFEADWLEGNSDSRVLGVSPGLILGNNSDELVLSNAAGDVVWQLAYGNDEANGKATFLTTDDYSVNNYGTKAAPGIVREGDDNGDVGFLGYEKNSSDFVVDPNAYESVNEDRGSPFFVGSEARGVELKISGDCPGDIEVEVELATPGGQVALVYSPRTGNFTIPGGNPCAGTELGLSNAVTLFGVFSADDSGDVTIEATVPGGACGLSVQAIDLATCAVTNVDQI